MRARNVVSAATVVLLVIGFGSVSAQAQSVVTEVPPATVEELASSIVSNDDFITGDVDFLIGGGGTAAVGSGDPLGGFPLSDASFAMLTTGDPSLAPTANSSGASGVAVSGTPTAGRGTAYDTTVLQVGITAPAGASCLAFTYRFFTDDEGAGSSDGFIAQLDSNDWSVSGTTVTRRGDFAAAGAVPVGSQGVGELALQSDFAVGTTYDAATGFLDAKTPVNAGENYDLFLSVFDGGNANVDSAVFIGRLGFTAEDASDCRPPGSGIRSAPSSSGNTIPPFGALPGRAGPLPAGSPAVPATSIPPNNKFRVLRTSRLADGSVRLRIRVPRAGVLRSGFARRRARQPSLVSSVRRTVPRSGVYNLRLRPTKAGRQRLQRRGRMRPLVRVAFTPQGGVALTEVRRFTFGPRRG